MVCILNSSCRYFTTGQNTSLKRARIIAISKPGKRQPENYRPKALLIMVYKLLKRVLFEQVDFRAHRSFTDQVLPLNTFIEAEFQENNKVGAALIDLTAAYDTVWRQGLIYKLMCIIPSRRITCLIDNMLSSRTFQVTMVNQRSKQRKLNNGLP